MFILRLDVSFHAGCVNGGAQLRPESELVKPRELASSLSEAYANLPRRPESHRQAVDALVKRWLGVPLGDGSPSNPSTQSLFTSYHAVEKMTNALNIKW
jgi:hypothetical protein